MTGCGGLNQPIQIGWLVLNTSLFFVCCWGMRVAVCCIEHVVAWVREWVRVSWCVHCGCIIKLWLRLFACVAILLLCSVLLVVRCVCGALTVRIGRQSTHSSTARPSAQNHKTTNTHPTTTPPGSERTPPTVSCCCCLPPTKSLQTQAISLVSSLHHHPLSKKIDVLLKKSSQGTAHTLLNQCFTYSSKGMSDRKVRCCLLDVKHIAPHTQQHNGRTVRLDTCLSSSASSLPICRRPLQPGLSALEPSHHSSQAAREEPMRVLQSWVVRQRNKMLTQRRRRQNQHHRNSPPPRDASCLHGSLQQSSQHQQQQQHQSSRPTSPRCPSRRVLQQPCPSCQRDSA